MGRSMSVPKSLDVLIGAGRRRCILLALILTGVRPSLCAQPAIARLSLVVLSSADIEPAPLGPPLHDCMLVFRFGNDPGITPSRGRSEARDINDVGQVAGWVMSADRSIRAVRWEIDGSVTDLGTLGGSNSCGLGINGEGAVVGWAETALGEAHAFRWDDEGMTDLSADRADLTVAYAISDVGDIAGMSWPLAAGPGSPMGRAVAWEAGTMVDLGTCLDVPCSAGLDINTFGEIVGWSVDEEIKRHAYIWDGVKRTDVGALITGASEARAINENGDVVGWFETEEKLRHAAFWTRGGMTDWGLEGRRSVANDIADTGLIVGAEAAPSEDVQPVLWDAKQSTVIGSLGGQHGEAYAVNDVGDVVGWSHTSDAVPHAFLWRYGVMSDLTPPMA